MGVNLGQRLIVVGEAVARGLPAVLVAADPSVPARRWWFPVSAVAGVSAVGIMAPAYYDPGGLAPLAAIALAVLVTLPILVIGTRPLLAWRIAWFAGLVAALTVEVYTTQPWPWHPAQMIIYLGVLWRAVTATHRIGTFWLWAFTVCVLLPFVDATNVGVVVLVVTGLVLLADQVRRRREVQRGLAAEAERSELEQARRALLEERARIARELHDVVAHSMSLVAVRAETAPYRLTGLPEPAAEEFTGIATAARDALTEMRRLLGVLRSDGPDPTLEPQPGLADLGRLIEAAREAGVTVTATLEGDVGAVPASVQLSAYRIVQEALSNASRHAPGAPVEVAVSRPDAAVEVVVRNGSGGSPPVSARAGLGLRGMRERAGMLGGSLTAGPTDDGGFEVVAHLPLETSP